MAPRRFSSRKLLVASVGLATINYVAACGASGGRDGEPTSGNLVAPPAPSAIPVDNPVLPPTSGNLVAPPSIDAGPPPIDPHEVDAGDDPDAGVD